MDSLSAFIVVVVGFVYISLAAYLGAKSAMRIKQPALAEPLPKRRVARIPMVVEEVGSDKDGAYAQLHSDGLWDAKRSRASVRFRGEYLNALQVGQKLEINVDVNATSGDVSS